MRVRLSSAHGFIGTAVKRELEVNGHQVNDTIEIDAFIHLRAWNSVTGCENDPEQAVRRNVEQTAELVKNALERGAGLVVYASTVSVYATNHRPIEATSPLGPRSVHALTKLQGEEVAKLLCEKHGAYFIAVRMPNVYGPRQIGERQHGVVARWFHALTSGEPAQVFGEGGERDYVHVDHAAKHIAEVLDLGDGLGVLGSAVILASGWQLPVVDLWAMASAAWLAATTKRPRHEVLLNMPREHRLHPSHWGGLVPDMICPKLSVDLLQSVARWWIDRDGIP